MSSIIHLAKNVQTYRNLAQRRAENKDFRGALSFLLSAKSISPNYEVIMDIADAYADMGLLELSNKFWFKYIDRAPKDKVSVAYEELAINYFYLDNFWASSYYFHLKLTTDGQIMKDGLDPEIIDFFSGAEIKKDAYRVVYPIDRANYNFEIKRAKHALAIGAFNEAKNSLSAIPEERRTEEMSSDLAISCFMSDDLDGAEKVCRQSIDKHGETVTAYCNLSTIYDMKEDFDNAQYYYNKALQVRKGEKIEAYKLATCAIERCDHQTAKECLESILEERPYEISMRFFYAVALTNLGNFSRAEKEFKEVLRINPEDDVVKYYVKLSEKLLEENSGERKLLPLEYVKELPKSVIKKYQKEIREFASNPQKAEAILKKEEGKTLFRWAVFCSDTSVAKDAVYVLSSVYSPFSKEIFKDALIDVDVLDEIKRVIIYVITIQGIKEKFGVVSGCFYFKFKPKKLLCEKSFDGGVYFSAYALCLARAVFFDAEGLDKIASACDTIYKKLSKKIEPDDVTNEEIATLILLECKFKWCKSDNDVLKFFEVSPQRLKVLKAILKGEKND